MLTAELRRTLFAALAFICRGRAVPGLCALLFGVAGAGGARATTLIGPDLSDVAVLSDGALEIQGLGGVARSDDGGKTWQVTELVRRPGPPFWKRMFKGPDGARYQNIVMHGAVSIVIRSLDNGVTWEHAGFTGDQALMVWADAREVFYFDARNLRVSDNENWVNWIGPGALHGLHGRHAFADYDHDFLSLDFDGSLIAQTYLEGSGGQPIISYNIADTTISGFFLDRDGTIFLTTRSRLYRGLNYGQTWEQLAYPPEWQMSTGPVPHASPSAPVPNTRDNPALGTNIVRAP